MTYTPVTEYMRMTLDEIHEWRQAAIDVLQRESEMRREATAK